MDSWVIEAFVHDMCALVGGQDIAQVNYSKAGPPGKVGQ